MKSIYTPARTLGQLSIALGLTGLLGGKTLNEFLGTQGRRGMVRLFGWREIAAGAGILASSPPRPGWLWARVAGGALGGALHSTKSKRDNIAASIAAVAGVTTLDTYCAWKLDRTGR